MHNVYKVIFRTWYFLFSWLTFVVLTISTSYQKLPFGSGDYPDKLLYHQALNLLCSRTRRVSTSFAYLDYFAFRFYFFSVSRQSVDHIICISVGRIIRTDTRGAADDVGWKERFTKFENNNRCSVQAYIVLLFCCCSVAVLYNRSWRKKIMPSRGGL